MYRSAFTTGRTLARSNGLVRSVRPRQQPFQQTAKANLSSSGKKDLPPPLPPSPAQAKKEYMKSREAALEHDPIAKMAEMQKELDIVRERAIEKLEKHLTQKTVWQRLTDPLRRHNHSLINVGAVLLAYVLAHNLYVTGRELRTTKEELEEVTERATKYHGALMNLSSDETLEAIAKACSEQEVPTAPAARSSSWFSSRPSVSSASSPDANQLKLRLEKEIRTRLGDLILSKEDIRIREMQKAWQESNNQSTQEQTTATPQPTTKTSTAATTTSPEQELLTAVLADGAPGALEEQDAPKKKSSQVFSM